MNLQVREFAPPMEYHRSIIRPQPKEVMLEKSAKLDLRPIAYKLMNPDRGEGWTKERVIEAVGTYRKLLVLNGMFPERPIVPTHDVDEVWHTHVQDTAKYRVDCDYLFGAFFDHFPYFGLRGEEDAQRLTESFIQTRKLYIEVFGFDPYEKADHTECDSRSCNSCSSCQNGCGCQGAVSGADNSRPTVDFVV